MKGLSQDFLADKLGMKNQSSYSKLESASDIPFSKLEQIAGILGVNPEDIITFNEGMVFNMMHNKRANGVVINQISQNEKKLYSEYIDALKEENAFLKNTIDKLLGKK